MPSTRTINILVNCPLSDPSCSGSPQPDPDFVLSRGRNRWIAEEATSFTETLSPTVEGGDYVLEVYEYSHLGTGIAGPRDRTCMTVTITG